MSYCVLPEKNVYDIKRFVCITTTNSGKKKYPPITYDYAQEEIAAKAGVKVEGGSSGDMALLQVGQ